MIWSAVASAARHRFGSCERPGWRSKAPSLPTHRDSTGALQIRDSLAERRFQSDGAGEEYWKCDSVGAMKMTAKMYRWVICLWLGLNVCVFAFGQKPIPPGDSSASVIGTWEGTLDVGTARLRLVLHIDAPKNGVLVGRLDSPDQGATDLPIDSLSLAGNILKFEMKSLAAIYEGKLESNGNQITGEFKQGVQAFPLTFKNTGRTATKGLLSSQKIDAGGHTLNMLIGGEVRPAVVFEAGFGSGLTSWSTVQSNIAKFARTVSYDRAGIGQSEAGPKPRAAKQIAAELHSALQNAGIGPPYVLVGHSFGGIYVRVFADMYPKEVAGMVLIDPSQETFEDWTQTHKEAQRAEAPEQMAKASPGVRDESAEVSRSYEQARGAKVPAGIPVILLSAMRDDTMPAAVRKVWSQMHEDWIAKVPGGKHVVVENSGHFIQGEQPQLVIDAIKQVVDQVSRKMP
jgi:pimeloyl-ACP methyl ester carboxylesterase